ncbi:DUF4012 domain-containing protein [Patescibacteria group bacterium]|nr:DUF4012 domain-containing protein [Patescibacteria group bacterium]MBU0963651.1 DUF4012 domain-containing protein [Patescibacteria group bacterium]
MPNKKQSNFTESYSANSKKKIKIPKYAAIIIVIIGSLIIISGALFLIYRGPAQNVYNKSISGKDDFYLAQDQLLTQDFTAAKKSLESAIINFHEADNEFNSFNWLKVLPWIGKQISAVDNLLGAGISTGESLERINDIADLILTPLQENENVSLNSLSDEETEHLLASVFNSKPDLELAKSEIDNAVNLINKIPEKGLINKIYEIVEPFEIKAEDLQIALDQAISASQIIPYISGYPEQHTYLFLLQNNTEIRPTGGFIGTYGILKIKNGDIVHFKTDNSYNLDKPAEAWLFEEPPWPLTRYNNVHQWFFRDSNWSPDFPTAAQEAERFYHAEKGPENDINGLIAVTPTFIESLMTLTGDISVDGTIFNSDNLIETLQYQVEQGFLRQGIEESERKEIIGVLSNKILEQILELPTSKWPDLWQVFSQDIKEKQILIYSKDDSIQDYIQKENWGGHIVQSSSDYFSVIDANLASLKTDPVVQRTINYTLREDSDNIIADLEITYANVGTITWKTTRYRTYTRILVPAGSTLLGVEGAMVDCKLSDEGSVETTEELGKTVFGTFICIEPNETKTLSFKYKLPDEITEQLKKKKYEIYIQKQPGTANHNINLSINLNKKPKGVFGIDNFSISDNNVVLIKNDLNKDLNTYIEY